MIPYLQDPDVTLYHGDALDTLRQLPDGCVDMVATSPPFYGLRDYGVDGQIGLETSPDEWVANLVAVFRECKRVLADHGTLWVEIGDSYGSSGGDTHAGFNERYFGKQFANDKQSGDKFPTTPRSHPTKPKDLLGQPWMLAKALRDPYYIGKISGESDRVWLAAMLDAEGCIAIHKRPAGTKAYSKFTKADGAERDYLRKTDSYQPKVEITNTSRAIMDRVVAIAGGNCDTKQEAGTHGRKQTIYRWTLTADKARDLLRELYPHLVGKQHEARLAYGCPSSGDGASEAHESLKALHRGDAATIDFAAPETMWEAGWFLRSEIIWARQRPNPMPESVTDRPTKAHSTVFLLSKQPRYFFDADAIRESYADSRMGLAYPNGVPEGQRSKGNPDRNDDGTPVRLHVRPPIQPQAETLDGSDGEAPRGPDGRRVTAVKGAENSEQHRDGERWPNPAGANARSVWTIPTEPTPFAHFATWPRKLVARMVLAGTSERGKCPECGKPWVRETERDVLNPGNRSNNGRYGSNDPRVPEKRGFEKRREVAVSTLGWSPACTHNLAPVPCTVLDPFAGSGTTCLVARNHGRHGIGIELNEKYLEIAAERLQQLSLLA